MYLLLTAALIVATLFTGAVLLVDRLFYRKRRTLRQGKEPALVENARYWFLTVLVLLVVRSFIAEPFRIPSDSMMPTLLDGDFVLVNRFAYGLRLPISNRELIPVGAPKRGDVAVFHYPGQSPEDPDKGTHFVKRVIGLPGDEVTYRDRRLYINGAMVANDGMKAYQGKTRTQDYAGYADLSEKLPGAEHRILLAPPPGFSAGPEGNWRVGPGEYLVMGDNRSNSKDGRTWGMVPHQNLVGKAFLICMNWDMVGGGIRFGRIGDWID